MCVCVILKNKTNNVGAFVSNGSLKHDLLKIGQTEKSSDELRHCLLILKSSDQMFQVRRMLSVLIFSSLDLDPPLFLYGLPVSLVFFHVSKIIFLIFSTWPR